MAYEPPDAVKARTNWSWNAAACALMAWYSWACAPNRAAMAADTSSWAAASNRVVGTAAAVLAAMTADPTAARSEEAAVRISGVAITNNIRGTSH
ncbi:hypothetical protein LAUMK22_01607 [Mycobacterium kansasii]|nr:hypothetical protein LAUMK22_01607 [Mycobacterium kansasii]VAZ66128.1 hypothetical protein LAUMK40_02260 [Mycobacterium kansasii]